MSAAEPSLAEQLREALERFAILSECAVRACEAQDADALAAAIDARELVTARLRNLVVAAGSARSAGAAAPAARILQALEATVRAATDANELLVQRVSQSRDELARQLERVNQDETGLAGYARAMPRSGRVDLRR